MYARIREHRACPVGFLTAVAVILTAAACQADKAAADGGKIDACKLVSAAEAGRILGVDVTVKPIDTSAAAPDAASLCSYQTGKVGGGFMLLAGRVHYTDAAAEVASRKKEELSGVPGLGEAAYLAKTPESLELHVLDHGAVIVVTVSRKPDDATVAQTEQVARAALGNLQAAR